MPSGATLPFVTFKDTGIQSVTSAISESEDENIVSTFLSMPSRNYLYGSNDVIIEGETDIGTNSLQTVGGTNGLSFQTFRIPDDADAITNISFVYDMDFNPTNGGEVSKTLGFELIKKVEVRVGNQIWQTLTGEDIFARNITENSFSSIHEVFDSNCRIQGVNFTEEILKPTAETSLYTLPTGNYNISGSVDLKLFCGSGNNLNSFLQCGAPNNYITVKIFYNDLVSSLSFEEIGRVQNFKNFRLIVKKHNFTSTEKEYINKNIVNNVINISQNVQVLFNPVVSGTNFLEKTFHIDRINEFNIQASHILITPIVSPYPDIVTAQSTNFNAFKSVYSRGHGGPFGSAPLNAGIHDCIKEVELFINGSSVTGKLSSVYLKSNAKKIIGLSYLSEYPIYCIPLASEKFGIDSLVLSKLRNKKLVITYDEAMLGGQTANQQTVLNITAVGNNVVTYVGGECSKHISN
jgi:hypothetical protein